ncbi:MAG: hypothetical protein IJ571_04575 [Ruminococcus sp.]|nr:hypothetical protein [Ruminococcus sp.]
MHDYKKVRKVVDGIHAEMALLVMDRLGDTISFNLLSSILSDFDEIHDDFCDKLDSLYSEKDRYEASKMISVVRKEGEKNG